MGKCNKVICDICGEHSNYNEPNHGTIKIKAKEWVDFYEGNGWVKSDIYICRNCFDDLRHIIRRERNSYMDSIVGDNDEE